MDAKTQAPEVLAVAGVGKSYGRLTALDDVSLTVHAGEFVALLGPNGAGKTTLFQLLVGLFVPDRGTIRIGAFDARRQMIKALAGLGVVFQQPTLDLELSVIGNLRFHAGLHGLGWRQTRARIRTELARFGLTERRRDRASKLSGGNRRRVELARALLHEPRLLLMDEATAGLDPASRRDLLDHVRALCRDKRIGVLWATHLVDEAETADRVVVLHRGHILFDGPPDGLSRQPGAASLERAFLEMTAPDPLPPDGAAGA